MLVAAVPWAPLHYDLEFDIVGTAVKVIARQTYMNMQSKGSSTLTLNAHELKDVSVAVFASKHTPLGKPPIGVSAKVRYYNM